MKVQAKGNETRYDQQHELEAKARRKSSGLGYFIPYVCSVCGKNRGQGSHAKCSRQLQQQRVVNG